jgi:hypothetical protein
LYLDRLFGTTSTTDNGDDIGPWDVSSFYRKKKERKKIPRNFKEPEGSSPCSQEPSTGPYPEPVRSSPYHLILSLQDRSFYGANILKKVSEVHTNSIGNTGILRYK